MKTYKTIIALAILVVASCSQKNMPPISGVESIRNRELAGYLISRDTEFSGEIIINGPLVVKKGAHLTILPGTTIKFKRIYTDGDDISDSEINVEGSIHAVGTPENKIIFTSYENDPKDSDWKFLMINFARESRIEHCRIEYAYSGVQVHFTKATVKNCEFRNNYDGVRFSTAKIEITDNDIHDNVNGIRYEERAAPALVTRNNIHNNNVGIFCVIKSDDLSTITRNNIFDNSDYNVKLGIKQDTDVSMPGNFWGSSDESAINKMIFDRKYDDQLGGVNVLPFEGGMIVR